MEITINKTLHAKPKCESHTFIPITLLSILQDTSSFILFYWPSLLLNDIILKFPKEDIHSFSSNVFGVCLVFGLWWTFHNISYFHWKRNHHAAYIKHNIYGIIPIFKRAQTRAWILLSQVNFHWPKYTSAIYLHYKILCMLIIAKIISMMPMLRSSKSDV